MGRPVTLVTASDRPGRFPTWHTRGCTYVLLRQNARGTSRVGGEWETVNGVETRVDDDEGSVTGGMQEL